MSYTIFYRMMAAKTEAGEYAIFAESGDNNVWGYSFNGKWQRDRAWRYIGTYADAKAAYTPDFAELEETGNYKAQRGKITNMIAKAIKKATTPENIMRCAPSAHWVELNADRTKATYPKRTLTEFAEIKQCKEERKSILLNSYNANRIYEAIK